MCGGMVNAWDANNKQEIGQRYIRDALADAVEDGVGTGRPFNTRQPSRAHKPYPTVVMVTKVIHIELATYKSFSFSNCVMYTFHLLPSQRSTKHHIKSALT